MFSYSCQSRTLCNAIVTRIFILLIWKCQKLIHCTHGFSDAGCSSNPIVAFTPSSILSCHATVWSNTSTTSLKCSYCAIALCCFCISTENKRVRTTINSFVRESKNHKHLNNCSYSFAAFCALAFFYKTL